MPAVKQIESRFKKSVDNLSRLYGFNPPKLSEQSYPFSITEMFNYAKRQMQHIPAKVELVITQESGYPFIATVKEIEIGMTLYYAPLEALWILHLKRKKDAFRVLLSVYSYLHQCAGMPALKEHNYVYDTYSMMRDSFETHEESLDEEDYSETINEYRCMERVVPILSSQIDNSDNLFEFITRVEQFRPADNFDKSLLIIAKRFLALWKEFPKDHFAANSTAEFLYPDEDDRAYLEQFFSFCWGFEGWMMDQLLEWVNCDLQEKSAYDLPYSIQKFDQQQDEEIHEFGYQKQLIDLLGELMDTISYLYE